MFNIKKIINIENAIVAIVSSVVSSVLAVVLTLYFQDRGLSAKVHGDQRRANLALESGDAQEALKIYDEILGVLPADQFSEIVADVYGRKAVCYLAMRRVGKPGVMLKSAIASCKEAIEVLGPGDSMPELRGAVLNNLGRAYSMLATSRNKTVNLGQALDYYERSLKVFVSSGDGLQAALVRSGMCDAYRKLSEVKDALDSLDAATTLCLAAKDVLGQAGNSYYYAEVLRFMGSVYLRRFELDGDRRNLSEAFNMYQMSLDSTPEDSYYFESAETRYLLGNTKIFLYKINGDKASLYDAIKLYIESMEMFGRADYVVDNAISRTGLGYALVQLYVDDGNDENLLEAISHFKASLSVLNAEDYPHLYLRAKNGIATTYGYLAHSKDRATNLKQAIDNLSDVLRVRPRGQLDLELVALYNNRGEMYAELADCENRDQNLRRALSDFELGIKILATNKNDKYLEIIEKNRRETKNKLIADLPRADH